MPIGVRIVLYLILGGWIIYLVNDLPRGSMPSFISCPQARSVVLNDHPNTLRVGSVAPSDREITLLDPVDFNFKSRAEVFDLRQRAIAPNSDLIDGDYAPYRGTFGDIVDCRPWWGIEGEFCRGPGEHSIDGPAEEGRMFLNPFLLLALDEAKAFTIWSSCVPAFPRPITLIWRAQASSAEVSYDISRFYRDREKLPKINGDYTTLELVNYNARDLGYTYIQVDREVSINIEPAPDSALFDQPLPLRNLIHLGGSCRYPGGCNNASPFQPEMMFKIKDLPATVTCKLWKKKPEGPAAPADFTFILKLQ